MKTNDYSKADLVKIDLITAQLSATMGDGFRITLKPRRLGLFPRNYGNQSKSKRVETGDNEILFSRLQLSEEVKSLAKLNIIGYEIYVTPISSHTHHIVIDDMSPDSLKRFIDDGYKPALIQESSEKDGVLNYQSIIIVNRVDNKIEQHLANKLVMSLNQKYGDPKLTGVIHPFRLAGFANKKEGRNNFFTKLIQADGCGCLKADKELIDLRLEFKNQQPLPVQPETISKLPKTEREAPTVGSYNNGAGVIPVADEVAFEAFTRRWQIEEKKSSERGVIDKSKIDWIVAQHMNAIGYTVDQIAKSLLERSPDLIERHPLHQKYISQIISRLSW